MYKEIKDFKKVIGFLDNDQSKWGGEYLGLYIFMKARKIHLIFQCLRCIQFCFNEFLKDILEAVSTFQNLVFPTCMIYN